MSIEIIIDGTTQTVTKQELFQFVTSGKVSADTPVIVNGKLVTVKTALTVDTSEAVRSSSPIPQGSNNYPSSLSSSAQLFCTNCGKPVANMSAPCKSCGAYPDGHQKFCKGCGSPINPEQVICTKCNTPTAIARAIRGTRMALYPLLLLIGAAVYNFATSNWALGIVCVVAAFIVSAIDERL